jgi:quercetin dioxygenase-like cupin family protein
MPWKLTMAGALVACAAGVIALGVARATPPQGLTATSIVAVTMGEVRTKAETDNWEIELKTKGLSDVYITDLKLVPGGHGGWHSHPGPSIIAVKAGTATFYQADDLDTPLVYPAGSGFVEDAGDVHILVNEDTVDLEVVVVQIVPRGAPRRIDEPDPRY